MRMPSTTSKGINVFPAGPQAVPGMTLDALMARQKEIALERGRIEPGNIVSPMQGFAYLGNVLANRINQGRADRQLAQAQQQVSDIITNIDPVRGANQAQIGMLAGYDRDLAMQLMRERSDRMLLAEQRKYDEAKEGRIDQRELQQDYDKMDRQAAIDAAKKATPSISDESALRQDVISDQAYKNMNSAMPIYTSMLDTAGRDDPVSDLNLVYGLAKIFDPGSVVKEGEMIMVQNAQGLPSYLLGMIDKANSKAGLGVEVRGRIMKEAYSRMKSYADEYKRVGDFYTGVAGRRNIDPANIVRDFGTLDEFVPPPPADGNFEVGKTYTFDEGPMVFKGYSPDGRPIFAPAPGGG